MSIAIERDPSQDLVDFWNEILVPKFFQFRHIIVGGLTHHSAAIFPTLKVQEGDSVLDIGFGFGDTAIELAKRVGPDGHVTGIDCCEAFLEVGREESVSASVKNIGFVQGDVQNYPFQPSYDFVFSRFGTMFFENPVRALRNVRTAMKPGAVMTMIVWRTIEDNPCLNLPKKVVLGFLPQPGEDARTCGPGPYSMSDPETVIAIMTGAGFVDVSFERVDAPILLGATTQECINFQLALGPAGEAFREAGDYAEQHREEIENALKEAIAPFVTAEGVAMGSSSWVITVRNPA